MHDDCVCALALAVQHYANEIDLPPLRLLNGGGSGGSAGESFVERAIRRNGAFFPSDWR
jgi:hypothetical protein